MDWFKFLPLIIFLIGALILILLYALVKCLQKKDAEKDYSSKNIQYFIQNIDGTDYLLVPYLFWQKGKLKRIMQLFSDDFELEGKKYKIEFLYSNQNHIMQSSDLLPQWLYRDCRSVIKRIESQPINYGNINNTFVSGNDNLVEIHQESNNKISSEIERIISNENFNDTDKMFLELFKYKLKDKSAKKDDANKAIDILTKALPLTTAVISLIKSIFFT